LFFLSSAREMAALCPFLHRSHSSAFCAAVNQIRDVVERFIVIDDEDDELDKLPLVQPSPRIGLTEKIAEGAALYLEGKSNCDMRCNRVKRFFQKIGAALRGHKG
jgi:hypothetical protein